MIPFATELTVLRITTPESYDHGRLVPRGRTAITIQGSIQPMSPKDIKLLPEGRANTGSMVLYTESELRLPMPDDTQQSDRVVNLGYLWEPVSEEPWSVLIPHRKYVLERREAYNG